MWASSRYWQGKLSESDCEMISFISLQELYNFTRLSVEMNTILRFPRIKIRYPLVILLVVWPFYLAKKVLFWKLPLDHIEQNWRTVKLWYEVSSSARLKKCEFFVEIIDYAGRNTWLGQLELTEHIIDAFARLARSKPRTSSFFTYICIVFSTRIYWISPVCLSLKYQPEEWPPERIMGSGFKTKFQRCVIEVISEKHSYFGSTVNTRL